ncbi:MAG: CoA pyrophosphatase [Candidatus Hydrogenedentales bacterium]
MRSLSADFARLRINDVRGALAAHQPDTAPSARNGRSAAVAMILFDGEEGLETLFIQRARHPQDPWSGQMAFPGGRQDPEDPTLEMAAERETLEEVGIRLDPTWRLGRLDDLEGGRLTQHRLSVSAFVYHHSDPPPVTPNYEVAGNVWVPLRFIADPANIVPYVFAQDPLARQFPSFTYQGYTVWGLTYRITSNFLRLFGRELPSEPLVTNVE